jgi:hypothetical protein
MSKRVYLPAHARSDAELLQDKVVPKHHVVYHVFENRTGFVVHRPAAAQHLELPILDQATHLILHDFILLTPPLLKKLHLDLGESAVWVFEQRCDDSRKLNLNICPLLVFVSAIEVLVGSLSPADVVMRVRNYMNCVLGS